MTRIILETDRNKDIAMIKELANRLKIKYKIQKLAITGKKRNNDLDYHYNVINSGIDVSNYGDPSLWQKKARIDRNINLS